MSVLVSFQRSGEWISAPRLTYATPDMSKELREDYLKAIDDSLGACAPLSFTPGLGGAIAGRPIMIRYLDNRDLREQNGVR